jgi:hypothetical protein
MAGILKSGAIALHSNGWHLEKHDLTLIEVHSNGWHFEKHDLAQWRCIQMAGILKGMAWSNGGNKSVFNPDFRSRATLFE